MSFSRTTLSFLLTLLSLSGTANAVTISGFVKRTDGTPVAQVDLDVFDSATGAPVFVLNDKTGVNGLYQIVLAAGTYDISYTPPRALRLAAFRHSAVAAAGTLVTLPDVRLEPGLLVSGHVQDAASPPLPAADVEVRFFDTLTGLTVFAAANRSDLAGDYSVLVPARTYNLIFAPAAGDTLLPMRIAGVNVAADVDLAPVSLSRGHLIEGDVVDPGAVAVAAVDADVFDAFTGDQILTVHDDTDPQGHYRFAVPAGTFDIPFFPPAAAALAATEARGVVVAGATVLPLISLPRAMTLSGRVVDHLGQPAANVDLDLVDLDTGTVYPTARDDTDAAGNYSVRVPPGLYDVHYGPLVGSGSSAAVREELSLTASMMLGDTVLPTARSVTGRLLEAGAPSGPVPVAGAKFVVFDDVSGRGYPSVGNPSAGDGTFSLALPPGAWVLEPLPPPGQPLVTHKLAAVDLTLSGVALGDVTLPRGAFLSGRVLGPAGPLRDVDLDVVDAAGTRIITPHDNTDPLGRYQVVVPAGSYSIEYEPPWDTDLAASSLPGITVSSPATTLPDVLLARGVVVTGRVISPAAAPLFNADLNVKNALGAAYLTSHDNTRSDGTFKLVLPPGGDAAARVDFVPARGARVLPASLSPLELLADTSLGDVTLSPGVLVSGQVTRPAGTGVRDVDLTVVDAGTGRSLFTPHDNTDGAGSYVVTVPTGLYNLQYIPPPPVIGGDKLVAARLAQVEVAADLPGLDIALENGVWAAGRVTTATGAGVAAADLDFTLPNGTVAFTPRGTTGTDGSYSVVVPPGIYDLAVDPPAGSRLMGALRQGVDLLADDRSLPTILLYEGYLVTGYLWRTDGTPVDGADLDVIDPVTGSRRYTPGDNTDPQGFYRLLVPPGVWDIHYEPLATSSLPAVRRQGVVVSGDTLLSPTIVPDGLRVEGLVLDAGVTPVPGTRAEFLLSGSVFPAVGNRTATDGRFRTFVPAGTYDIVFLPPAGSGLAPLTRAGVAISRDTTLADVHLATSVQPTLTGISAASGSSAGGLTVTLGGTNFTGASRVYIGGVEAAVISSSSGSIIALTPSHPPGRVDVSVVNPGSAPSILAQAFTFVRRTPDIAITMVRSGDDLVLSWSGTAQAHYTVYRAAAPAGLASPVVVGITGATSVTVPGGAHASTGSQFYDVE